MKCSGQWINQMQNKTIHISFAVMIFMFVQCFGFDLAFAHRVNVFAWVEGDIVYTKSKFGGGREVKGGKIVVMDSLGNELLS